TRSRAAGIGGAASTLLGSARRRHASAGCPRIAKSIRHVAFRWSDHACLIIQRRADLRRPTGDAQLLRTRGCFRMTRLETGASDTELEAGAQPTDTVAGSD